MRDNKSTLLALLAAGLVVTWVYHIYDKSQYANKAKKEQVSDSVAVAQAVSDSLRDFFLHTMSQLGNEKIQVDSANNLLNVELLEKFNEIKNLRMEIGDILKRKNITQADLTDARIKIDSLRKKQTYLIAEDKRMTDERNRLNGIITQLDDDINSRQQATQKNVSGNKPEGKRDSDKAVFSVADIRFVAYNVQPGQKEAVTTQQENAYKFISSFTVRNNISGMHNAEIIAVVTDPSGKSVNAEVWDVGSFETRTEGRKIYTQKIRFEYIKGEAKRLAFSLEPDSFQKGTYKLSLYYNGIRIGESSWKLS